MLNNVERKRCTHLNLPQPGQGGLGREECSIWAKTWDPGVSILIGNEFHTFIYFTGFLWGFSSIQLLSHVRLFATPCTAAHQASLSITNSWSLLKLMSIESVMPSNHLILSCPLLLLPSIFPSIRFFSNELVLHIMWPKLLELQLQQLVHPMNIQDWFPLGLIGWISLQSKGLSSLLFKFNLILMVQLCHLP